MSSTVIDYIVSHPSANEWYLGGAGDDELSRLFGGLLRFYSHVAPQLRTKLGMLALTAALEEIADQSSDFDERHAAALILAHAQAVDHPGMDSALRTLGWCAFEQRLIVIDETERFLAVIDAINKVWVRLLPEVNTKSGRGLLQKLAGDLEDEEKEKP
jgi:hypothetical protein